MNQQYRLFLVLGFSLAIAVGFSGRRCVADTRVGDMCRVKGMEINTLRGLGLVVGLNGTGEPDGQATIQALARMLRSMGSPQPQTEKGQAILDGLTGSKNVALVFVTATIPEQGAQQGDLLDCSVHSFGKAKSLKNGYLMITPLLGPRPIGKTGSQRVYALAEGLVQLNDPTAPLTAKVHKGCKLEETFQNEFIKDGKITLVLDKNHANFQTAGEIADRINKSPIAQSRNKSYEAIAKALGPKHIEIHLPSNYTEDPVEFVAEVLDQQIFKPQNEARVVINERAGTVVFGANVEIGPVAVSTKNNISVEAGPFFPLDPGSRAETTTKLKALVDALNAIKATDQDIIEIIKGIERNGQLYGKLIIE